MKTELIHNFNVNTLIIDKEIKELFDREINLFLTPLEVEENAVVGAIWNTAGDTRVCFPKNTKIETISGSQNIQNLKEGDVVLSHLGWRKITKIMKRKYSKNMIKIKTSQKQYLIATYDHPIFETKKGWIEMQSLRKGDRLKTSENKIVNVVSIQNIRFFKSYNFISKLFQFFIFSCIFKMIMPIISIGFNASFGIGKKKINTVSFNLKFLNKVNCKMFKTISNFFFKRSFTRVFTIARKRTESFIIFLIRTNSKLFSTIKAFNIYRWSSTFLRTIMICSMSSINNFTASFTRSICDGREFAFHTTKSISGFSGLFDGKCYSTPTTNLSYPLSFSKYIMAFPGAKYRSTSFDFPNDCIKRIFTNLTNKILSCFSRIMIAFIRAIHIFARALTFDTKFFSAIFTDTSWLYFYTRLMITFLRAIFLARTTGLLKFISTKITIYLIHFWTYFSKIIHLCQAFNVYNIEVENAHTYYANGILVHNCPLCEALDGQIFPVESGEFARLEPPIHNSCRCMLRYVTGRQRGIEERLKEYRPTDPELLKKWSSKVFTDTEIKEMIVARKAFPPEEGEEVL